MPSPSGRLLSGNVPSTRQMQPPQMRPPGMPGAPGFPPMSQSMQPGGPPAAPTGPPGPAAAPQRPAFPTGPFAGPGASQPSARPGAGQAGPGFPQQMPGAPGGPRPQGPGVPQPGFPQQQMMRPPQGIGPRPGQAGPGFPQQMPAAPTVGPGPHGPGATPRPSGGPVQSGPGSPMWQQGGIQQMQAPPHMGPGQGQAQQQQQQPGPPGGGFPVPPQPGMMPPGGGFPGAPRPLGAMPPGPMSASNSSAAGFAPGVPGPLAGPPVGPPPMGPGGPPPAGFPGGPPPAGFPSGPPPAGFPGGMPPPGMGGMPGGPPPPPGGYDLHAGQRLVEQFESLVLSAGPGSPEVDTRTLPRPIGAEREAAHAAQQPFDKANCSTDNMRPTVMGVPNSTALRLRWQLPLGIIVRPMADEALGRDVPVIPLGSQGIVRCRRCRTYMNPFCTWVDGGRRFKCNVCAMLNEVPVEYFSTLDANGIRRDIMERPELHCGTVEWVAPQEYMVRPPMPPVYFFAIDVSQAAFACGMVSVVASTIKACLDKLPGDERTMVGFLTYDAALHFYNLKASLAAPQMLVVPELDDPFLPLPDDLLVNLRESREVIEALLDALPSGYSSNTSSDSAMGPALQAAFLVMGHVGGKLLMFQSGMPTLGPGKLKPSRDNLNLYNTDRESSLRNPEDPFFKRYAAEASSRQITLDVFMGTNGYADLASLASIPRYTCGQVYHYPGFHAPRDGSRLVAELTRNLTRATAWEAVMRIRCSRGLKITSFHGHFFNRSTDLLALPTCDPDKAFAVQVGHEETMVQGPVSYVQCALLHTSSNGERRIRVHTMMLPVLSELSELYRAADGAATACLLAKLGVEKSLMAKLEDTRQALQAKLSAALKEYRLLHGAHARNPGALIYPSTLKYLPAYVLGLIKSTAFRGSGREVAADERSAAAHLLMAAPVDETLQLAYPDVYMLGDGSTPWGTVQQGEVVLPPTVPASLGYLHPNGCYLLDNGQLLVLWIGREAQPDWLVQVLGAEVTNPSVDPSTLPLEPARDSAASQRMCSVLQTLRSRHTSSFAPAFAVRQGTPLEAHVFPLFVEDRSQGQFGYSDFLQQLHRMVSSK